MRLSGWLGLLLIAGLAGCSQGGDVQSGSAANSAPTLAGPQDGTYRGTMRLTRDGSGQCGSASVNRTLTVRNGQGRLVYNPGQGFAAIGAVQPDGSFRLIGQAINRVEISGRIESNSVRGSFVSNTCEYDIDLQKVA